MKKEEITNDYGYKTYIVACNAEPTAVVIAENKKQAVKMTRAQAREDIGECDNHWTAYEINDYFKNHDFCDFFGWVKNPIHSYLKHV